MHITVQKYITNMLYLLHLSATHMAVLTEVHYKGRTHQDITKVCEQMHRCKILSLKNTWFKILYQGLKYRLILMCNKWYM
jgi:hypothetical protein